MAEDRTAKEPLPESSNFLNAAYVRNPAASNLFDFSEDVQAAYAQIKNEIGDFQMDNLNEPDGTECLGLFQESFNPIGLHVDAGFNLKDIIFKQTLLPLSNFGETVIFKNR